MIQATEIIPVQAMEAPWDFADKHYPGGFEQYCKDILMIEFEDEDKDKEHI